MHSRALLARRRHRSRSLGFIDVGPRLPCLLPMPCRKGAQRIPGQECGEGLVRLVLPALPPATRQRALRAKQGVLPRQEPGRSSPKPKAEPRGRVRVSNGPRVRGLWRAEPCRSGLRPRRSGDEALGGRHDGQSPHYDGTHPRDAQVRRSLRQLSSAPDSSSVQLLRPRRELASCMTIGLSIRGGAQPAKRRSPSTRSHFRTRLKGGASPIAVSATRHTVMVTT